MKQVKIPAVTGLRRTAILLVGSITAALTAGTWYYTNLLRKHALRPNHDDPHPDVEVTGRDEEDLVLRDLTAGGNPGLFEPGTWGLEWPGGYARLGEISRRHGDRVWRRFTPVRGMPGEGTHARLDNFAFPGDPRTAHGYDFDEVSLDCEVGTFPAWLVEGEGTTWAIVVHGKGAHRGEGHRTLPAFYEKRIPTLLITYRNDRGLGVDPSGHFAYGASEWRDLEAAVDFALALGAQRIVLVGFSMGGGIIMSFMSRSGLARYVSALVLDAPMLDFEQTVESRARDHGAPRFLTSIGKRLAGFRFGVRWSDLNYLPTARQLTVPVLLFHGTADREVPVASSDQFAGARPDIVTYHRVEGAGHVRAWNVDQQQYERALRTFLDRVV